MTPTIQTFIRALLTPDLAFGQLADARAVVGADGWPQMMRTTRFAEAEIEWQGRRWLLSLQQELRGLDFAHGNLRDTNLRWVGDRFIPLRYHDARFGHPEIDEPAFEALRERILRESGTMLVSDVAVEYDPLLKLTGHRWVHPISEGLACVEDDSGWGYVDPENRVVIPSTFEWADSFHEGRAEVRTATGMGLIDRRGAWIIPPLYEIIDYNPVESNVYVRKEGLWAEFDYLGRQQSAFGEREART